MKLLRRRGRPEVTDPYRVAVDLAQSGDRLGVVFLELVENIARLETLVEEAFELAATPETANSAFRGAFEETDLRDWVETVGREVARLVPPADRSAALEAAD
jgi:hypothetical protein